MASGNLRSLFFDIGFKGDTSKIIEMDSAADKLKQGMGQASDKIDLAKNETDKLSNSLNKTRENSENAISSISKMAGKLSGVMAAFVFGEGVKTLANTSDTFSQISSRIGLMNDGLQTNEQLQAKIATSALDTHTSYAAMSGAVTKIGTTAGSLFDSSSQVVDFVEQLNKSFIISGATTEEQNSATLQLSQSLASGVLRGDELNSIFENAPSLIDNIAKYMGVPKEQIRKLGEQGKISAEIIKNSVLDASTKTNTKFGEMGITFAQVWTDFKTKSDLALGPAYKKMSELAQSDGFKKFTDSMVTALSTIVPMIVDCISKVVDIFNNPSFQDFLTWISKASGKLQVFMPTFKAIATVIGLSVIAMKLWTIATTVWAAVTGLATTAMDLFNLSMAANPIATVIVIIMLLVSTIMYFYQTNEGFRNGLNNLWGAICKIFSDAGEGIKSIWGSVSSFFQGVVDDIGSTFAGISDTITGAFDGAFTFMAELPNKFLEWGGDMVQGLVDGIKKGIGAVGDAVKSVADKITSFLHFSRPDEGPLAEYESWMPDFMKGLASGISNNKGLVHDALSGLSSDMTLNVKSNNLNPNVSNADNFRTVSNRNNQNVIFQTTIQLTTADIENATSVVNNIGDAWEQRMENYIEKLGFRNPPQFAR